MKSDVTAVLIITNQDKSNMVELVAKKEIDYVNIKDYIERYEGFAGDINGFFGIILLLLILLESFKSIL